MINNLIFNTRDILRVLKTYYLILNMMLMLSIKLVTCQDVFDTIQLQEVKISGNELSNIPALSVYPVDSIIIAGNESSDLADLLSKSSSVFIKSYGRGSTASASIRGSTSSQVQLLWNGININSPSLGQSDLALVPVFFLDNIAVLPGGSSLTQTTGGIGGGLSITNKPIWKREFSTSLTQSIGSFKTYDTYVKVVAGSKEYRSVSRVLYQRSENDFSYINIDKKGSPIEKRENAAFNNQAFQQELYTKINNYNILSAIVYLQKYYREIPPSTVQVPQANSENQDDFNIRSLIQWKYIRNSWLLKSQFGFLKDRMEYRNEKINMYSLNESDSWYANLEFIKEFINDLKINVQSKNNYQYSVSDNIGGVKERWISSFMIMLSARIKKIADVNILFREEYNQEFAPILPAISVKVDLLDNELLSLNTSASKNHRFPTLNDLYWRFDGFAIGNPNLKPETGYNADLGFSSNYNSDDLFSIKANVSGFYSYTNNMILWKPGGTNKQIWMPLNLHSVEAKGVEIGFQSKIGLKKLIIQFISSYSYTQSINIDSDSAYSGKQLIYIPLHQGNAFIYAGYRGFKLQYDYQYTGKRYTVADNSRYLPPYSIHNIGIEKNIALKEVSLGIEFKVSNLFDKQYRAIVRQPMPGRNYELLLKLFFNKKLKKNEKS